MTATGSVKNLRILSSLETSTSQGEDGGRQPALLRGSTAEQTPLLHLPDPFTCPSLPHHRTERRKAEAKGLIAKLRSIKSVSSDRLEGWITKLSPFLNALGLSKALWGKATKTKTFKPDSKRSIL